MTEELEIHFVVATRDHLSSIVSLLADDQLGSTREIAGDELDECYLAAFGCIETDSNNELIVAEHNGSVVATLQITYAANLTHKGAMRATIEGVRVDSAFRSLGVGTRLLHWSIDRCRSRGCQVVQLTCDLIRPEALKFYEGLGFKHSHAGLKLWL
ncbi:MAG: GNAT family N-acetyltransferase [Planctomycetota bacterium]